MCVRPRAPSGSTRRGDGNPQERAVAARRDEAKLPCSSSAVADRVSRRRVEDKEATERRARMTLDACVSSLTFTAMMQ